MLNSEIGQNTQNFPVGFKRDFDAHVYYTESTRAKAMSLRKEALGSFKEMPVFIGDLVDYPVGPHPVPMFELNFSSKLLGEVLLWLLHHRGDLSVLVHEVTGDDPKDHSRGAIWLGTQLPLDESKLDPAPSSGPL